MQTKKYEYQFSEEDFNKLPQLSRIEYRQRESIIKDNYKNSLSYPIIISADFVLGFLVLLAITGYGAIGKSFFNSIVKWIAVVGVISLIAYLIALVLDAIREGQEKKELKALKDYYFNFKIEVKKK